MSKLERLVINLVIVMLGSASFYSFFEIFRSESHIDNYGSLKWFVTWIVVTGLLLLVIRDTEE